MLVHRSGGPTETIRDGKDGMFFDKVELHDLMEKMRDFDQKVRAKHFDPDSMKAQAAKFSKQKFQNEFYRFVMDKWQEKISKEGFYK